MGEREGRVDSLLDTLYNLSEEKEAFFIIQKMKKLFSVKLSKSKVILVAACLLLAGSGTAYAAHELTKQSVSVSINGKKKHIRTHAKTVGDLLETLDIKTRDEDKITPAKQTNITADMDVVYEAAKPVKLTKNGEEKTLWSTAKTVGALLDEKDVDVKEHDQIDPAIDTDISKDMKINIEPAFQVTVNDAGKQKKIWTTSTTVADFLKQQKMNIKDEDKIKPALDAKLTKGKADITITRIEKVTDVVEEKIAFDVKKQEDASLEKGIEKVVQKGKEGKLKKHFEVVKENGKEVSRELVKEETAEQSKDKVVAVGTKQSSPKIEKVSASGDSKTVVSRSNESTGKVMTVSSTAYTASCSGCSGHTATGVNLKNNPNAKVIAVDPNVIPLGSKVHVEGYGYAIAADTGSAIKGNKIDVFFPEKSSAYRWGNKTVKIKILN
ncbi:MULTISPECIES: ubiquitin-like domain-containing protein [Bacillus]|uniref:ubiquitin-like domain-containing protein n=1 Tax=Bacillus TaxID=1386 RepID=UPI001CDBE317|nr:MULTISPECIES: ubiquitin-like domain-containing protein [Bacillus]MCY8502515.1 ubiquitin-like domain-containing protein [Bacillus inaquosorum]MCY8725115.1 ubiquitin-like domain-containing protein [Bacillus inaquosorum]MCY8788070.1 ubiquitin-like domain-containing protein [Bacillus inaquosorum]MCY9070502.1 ubiquitin-like domain-containing protein [Bacillus inaquosorum]MEC0639516.1 ubiquitin-like domain-containing protein [Bacillus inaquosorum]